MIQYCEVCERGLETGVYAPRCEFCDAKMHMVCSSSGEYLLCRSCADVIVMREEPVKEANKMTCRACRVTFELKGKGRSQPYCSRSCYLNDVKGMLRRSRDDDRWSEEA